MIKTITMPENWNLIFRDEILLGEGVYSTSFEDMEGFFEINVNFITSLDKYFIENVQLRGLKEILKDFLPRFLFYHLYFDPQLLPFQVYFLFL